MINNSKIQKKQEGFILFICLVFLMVITILGIAAMENSIQQERMSGGYRSVDVAFQEAEAELRGRESEIEDTFSANRVYEADTSDCVSETAEQWANRQPTASTWTQRIDLCDGTSSLAMGRSQTLETDQRYRVISLNQTGTGPQNRGARVVLETIYIP